MKTLLLALTGYLLILSGSTACAAPVGTSEYVFISPHSTILQTGGVAGVHWTYTITGEFRLMVDPEAGTASFDRVDANATDDSSYGRTLDPNEVFNLTGLAGKVVDETTIRFAGKVADGSSVVITLTFAGSTVTLKGETTPPPNSADFFVFALDAVAQRQDVFPIKTTEQFIFVGPESTILQTGGIAGVHWTYAITGKFRLTVDPEAGTASFDQVGATATDDSPYQQTLDLNKVFNLTGLTGRVVDATTIRFEGKAADGSTVAITLTFADAAVTLQGQTTPPPNSADFFVFTLDAVAQRKYAGGTGEPNDPYLIETAEQLNTIGAEPADWDRHFKLVADIDLGLLHETELNAVGYWHAPWDCHAFVGTFDGNGHRILNLHHSSRTNEPKGLFGFVSSPNARITSLTLVDPNIDAAGTDAVGSLVGYLQLGAVKDCHVTGGQVSGHFDVGGLVGYCNAGHVIGCSALGTVKGTDGVGGLVGLCSGGGEIRQSASGGSVISNGSVDTVGGLVGSTIGVLSRADIVNCYSYAKVSGTYYVGGLIGALGLATKVTNCYSTGAVSGTVRVGGLIGFASNIAGYKPDVEASFWDVEASGQTRSAAGVGETTAEMQKAETFLAAGWDFVGETANGKDDIWWMKEGKDYPRLAWEQVLSNDSPADKAEPR